jgi:2-methylcitrate dehydratase PrpD
MRQVTTRQMALRRPHPQSGLDGKFSFQYTAAIALLDGKIEPASLGGDAGLAHAGFHDC